MKWLLKSKFIILIIILSFVASLLIISYYDFDIHGNEISLLKKVQLSHYLNKKVSLKNDKNKYIIIVITESICENNLFLAYKLISEFNPNYIYVLFNSKYVDFIKPLNKIYTITLKNGNSYYIDPESTFLEIFTFVGYPLILYAKNNKIIGGVYLQKNNYDKITNDLTNFIFKY